MEYSCYNCKRIARPGEDVLILTLGEDREISFCSWHCVRLSGDFPSMIGIKSEWRSIE